MVFTSVVVVGEEQYCDPVHVIVDLYDQVLPTAFCVKNWAAVPELLPAAIVVMSNAFVLGALRHKTSPAASKRK